MATVKINKERCKGCGLCVMYCPKGCLAISDEINKLGIKPAAVKENSNCTSCTFCALICPDCAIEIYKK
jgi:2-oxoglutarate ferredoxin oxidoreductase subunit delta